MINEFFCWLVGHQSFTRAKVTKIYKRQGRRFVYTGMDLCLCKRCNKHFIKVTGVKTVFESTVNLFTEVLPEIVGKDVSNTIDKR